ncbi:MAG TPA: beta-ketoacyl synthase N-terminal-like domain-containing protein [Kofleriaceae bacterium]
MREPVAIVGMAAVFPGAADLDTYWANLAGGVDAIRDVPADRWDPIYFDPAAKTVDRIYCRRGGFVAATFDPIEFGIMPVAAATAEPDQLLALHVAARALADAGYGPGRAPTKTGVILGRGGYFTPGLARFVDRVRTAQQLATTLAELAPELDAATLAKIRTAFAATRGEAGAADAVFGLVPNLAASRIANRLDLRGPAYTVDAACASSLIAVDQAIGELAARRCDVMLAGGVHICHDVVFWSVFAQLGALSRAQQIRPFDRRADGILIGEGAGIVVLKRLDDAQRDHDRIYAVIRGTAVASDGRDASPMRPRPDGQRTVLADAWAGIDRAEIGLVEAHGTATAVGDDVELTVLAEHFGARGPRAALGSVKSMIGHAMPASGAAGLIKAALALHHETLPPSLHAEEPHPTLAQTRFRIPSAAEPWERDLALRAGVSAFGFGGINAHVVLESPRGAHGHRRTRTTLAVRDPSLAARDPSLAAALPTVARFAGATIDEVRDRLARNAPGGAGPVRLALVEPTADRIARAEKVLARGRAWRGNHDIFFAPAPLGGSVAFLFPGIEVGFAPQLDDVAAALGAAAGLDAIAPGLDAIAAARAGGCGTSRELEVRGAGVFALGRLLADALGQLGLAPAFVAGHSMGEWTAMVASELIPPAIADAFVADLRAGSLDVPDVIFAAAGCSAAGAQAALDGLAEIAVSHDNCPHQSILCGRRESVRVAVERLGARGVLCQELPFRSGFHSPLFAEFLARPRAVLASLSIAAPRIPIWSATSCAPFPATDAAIRALVIDHLLKPVRFRELIEGLYATGVRAFVQLGVGSLVGFVDDTLRGKDHLAVTASSDKHSGLSQLARVAAAAWADGYLDDLADARVATRAAARAAAPATAPSRAMPLQLGATLVRLGPSVASIASLARGTSLGAPAAMPRVDAAADPLLAELVATFDEAASAARAVVEAYRARSQPAAPAQLVVERTFGIDSDPYLLDHCFYRQPPGWTGVADRYPVVPMTMILGLLLDAAQRLAPDRIPIALEDVRAYRWLAVAPPVTVEIRAERTGPDRIAVEIPGFSRAEVVLAAAYPPPPAPQLPPLAAPRPAPLTAARMYADRWMFHGPAYQGVVQLGPLADDGIDGEICVGDVPGALLDCAGQLMGWWVMHTATQDRLAMPVRIERVELYGAHPAPDTRVACRVRMRGVGEREARADLELVHGERVWARLVGWETRRFDSDDVVWDVMMYPERHTLATHDAAGIALVTEHWRAAASRELMLRRYLGERERAQHEALGVRARRGWLLGRMAVKDAVRRYLWDRGAGDLWPVQVEVDNEAGGRPIVRVEGARDLRVSVAHKDDTAVAIVGEGRDVGIDLERIEPRTDAFLAVAFTDAELALGDGPEHHARLWAAKEAVAKQRGTGLTDPKAFAVTRLDGDTLWIGETPVATRRAGEYLIAWTKDP